MKLRFVFAAMILLLSLNGVFGQEMTNAVKTGDTAPDFTLTDHNSKTVKLSEAVKAAPVVLVFYRGYWCPFCARQLADLRGLLNNGEKTQLFAVSIDPAEKSNGLIKKIESDGKGKVNFRLLSDPDAKTIDAYGLRDPRYAQEKVNGIPYPTVLVIDKNRKITWSRLDKDYKQRPTNEEIRAEIGRIE